MTFPAGGGATGSVGALADAFLRDCRERGLRDATLANYGAFTRLLARVWGERDACGITPRDLAAFREQHGRWQARTLATFLRWTAAREKAVVSGQWPVVSGQLPATRGRTLPVARSVALAVVAPVVAPVARTPRFFSPAEAERFFAAVSPRFRACFALALYGGLRPAECCRLRWRDISCEERRVRVPAETAKTRRARVIEGEVRRYWRLDGGAGQWSVASGQWSVASGQWSEGGGVGGGGTGGDGGSGGGGTGDGTGGGTVAPVLFLRDFKPGVPPLLWELLAPLRGAPDCFVMPVPAARAERSLLTVALPAWKRERARAAAAAGLTDSAGAADASDAMRGANAAGAPAALPPDILRHTFLTYLVALTQNTGLAAKVAGHCDLLMLADHYDGVATRADAEKFFHCDAPPRPEDVADLPRTAAELLSVLR